MAEMDVKSFVEALNSDRGIVAQADGPVVLVGFIKPSGSADLVLFAPENACHNWIPIPVALIRNIDHHGKRPCLGVPYDYVYIYLRFADSPEGNAVQELLRTTLSLGGSPPPSPADSAAARGIWNCNAWYWLKGESYTRYHNFTVTANTHQEALVAADWTMRGWLERNHPGKWIRYNVTVSGGNRAEADRPQDCGCPGKGGGESSPVLFFTGMLSRDVVDEMQGLPADVRQSIWGDSNSRRKWEFTSYGPVAGCGLAHGQYKELTDCCYVNLGGKTVYVRLVRVTVLCAALVCKYWADDFRYCA